MSVVIFDKEEELRKSLLPAQSGFEGGVGDQPRQQGPGYGLEPSTEGSLEAGTSTTSLDSSRKTLNQAAAVDQRRERDFEGGLIVELSKTESKISRSRGLSSSSMEDNDSEEISGGEEEGHRPLFAINYTFLDHARSPSGAYSTLPRPFNPKLDSVVCETDRNRTKYEEAALYVREGEDDAKFYHHPANRWSKLAYDTLHHPAYHVMHLLVCILLLLLAFAETPAVGGDRLSEESKRVLVSIHGVLELIFLSLLGCDLVIRYIWFGGRHFIQQRTTLLTIILVVMYAEALAVLIRQQNHIRITRVLRPIFLIDTYYMVGVRRVLRQIFISIRPIVDVLFLLIFFVVLFALFGYLIFADADPDYFSTFARSYISLFITQTTANNPDVMMESYSDYPATPIFFVVYIILTLYFAANVLLAVVYSSFSEADKKKFRKIFLHKREALGRAFGILGYDPELQDYIIQFHDFVLFMAQYKPRIPEWQVMCIFKALHKNPAEPRGLTLDDFYHFYEVINYKWDELDIGGQKLQWFTRFPSPIRKPIAAIHRLVTHRLYKFSIGLIVLINAIFLVAYLNVIDDKGERFANLHRVLPVSFTFLGIYIVDILLNIIGQGPHYFRKFWNLADLAMVIFSLICLGLEVNPRFMKLAIIRPLKLLRLIRLKRRYRDLMNTMVALAPRLLSIFFLILIIYYAFAIVGLEFFAGRVHQHCCNTSWYGVKIYYSASIEPLGFINNTDTPYVYYLNSFNNILRSYVTLFILMVINNWYIIMEGIASEVDTRYRWLARIYFMTFYIIILVVLQVIISFIVEAFVFKIQATQKRRTCSRHPNAYECNCKELLHKKKTEKITLKEEDIAKLRYETVYLSELQSKRKLTFNVFIKHFKRKDFSKISNRDVEFLGRRDHTKEDIHTLMYKDELKNWIRMYERKLRHKEEKSKKTLKGTAKRAAMEVMQFLID